LSERVKVAFASCSEDLIPTLIEKLSEIYPELPLWVVSEFPVENARWIPYHVRRGFGENLALCRAAFRGSKIVALGLVLQPRMPYWRMRLIGALLAPLATLFFNENLDHFMLRPRSAAAIAGHFWWRAKNLARWELRPGGGLYTLFWRLAHPRALERPIVARLALAAGWMIALSKTLTPPRPDPRPGPPLPEGITVVIPSRNGRRLLDRLLAGVRKDLEDIPSEIVVVDNGSEDSTDEWLRREFPEAILESSAAPLSFARAANAGIRRARYSHLCLLNNDMVVEPGFFRALRAAFHRIPDLFCATAQILFPEGKRRQETGKAVMPFPVDPESFPIRCEPPLPGEDLSWVLYGSGGCSLYETTKLRRLGGLDEAYEPAYCEDLDLGWRGWLRGWPTVFAAGALVVHHHRATTSRYYTEAELQRILEVNYLRFLVRGVASARQFLRLWRQGIRRLNLLAARTNPEPAMLAALRVALRGPFWLREPPPDAQSEDLLPALAGGEVAVFPGLQPSGRPLVVVASPYQPYPLAHGAAVRIYNLMRRGAAYCDQVLVCFVEQLGAPPPELLELCVEIVQVRRRQSHAWPATGRPDVVEEYDHPGFRSALRQVIRKWRPGIVQLEFTQMAQYAAECAPARTILVEHDITYDLFAQMLAGSRSTGVRESLEEWELRLQWRLWKRFETDAWRCVDRVATMSEKDRRTVGAPAVCLPNGVDLDRFTPSVEEPEPRRLLFIGSFAHLPNLLAVDFFLREVWPLIASQGPRLHIIAGSRHRYYLERARDRVRVNLDQPGVEVEDFVADPRPAYRRASLVIAPLVASAGTNIKILEAMAMGKAIVSTPAGIHGLHLEHGAELLVTPTAAGMAGGIEELLGDPARRRSIEQRARAAAERRYGWDAVAAAQKRLYESLRPSTA